MDYEKRYEKALERAKKLKETCDSTAVIGWCEHIFPELKESEDEEMRKGLINYIKKKFENTCSPTPSKNTLANWIAWLEKRSSCQNDVNHNIAENEKKEFIGDGFIRCCADFQDFREGKTYWLEYLGDDNYNVRSDNLLGKTYHITPCQLYTVFKKLTWLEKQGEQKPDDKVEPKFKAGDWIIDKQGLVHQIENVVENVTNHTFGYDIVGGGYFNDNSDVRLWTIKDAKDRDVLVASDGSIFIYKCQRNNSVVHYIAVTSCNDLAINENDYGWENKNACHPATKEQRDCLFQRIKEDGYEWNTDKKELIKL